MAWVRILTAEVENSKVLNGRAATDLLMDWMGYETTTEIKNKHQGLNPEQIEE